MKKIAIFLTIIISILICGCKEGTTNNETVQVAVEGIPIDEDNFPDEYFRDYLEKNVDKDLMDIYLKMKKRIQLRFRLMPQTRSMNL